MTDRELWAFVDFVRQAHYELADADRALSGIFGYGHTSEQAQERDYKINLAKAKFIRALDAMNNAKDYL